MANARVAGWIGLVAAVGVAGCSSGGDGSPASFDGLVVEYEDIAGEVDALPLTPTDALPASGSATYHGVLGFDTEGVDTVPAAIAGDLSLTAHFADSSMTGRVDDLVTDEDVRLSGSLAISPLDDEDRAAAGEDVVVTAFGFDVNGTLTEPGGTPLDVEAEGYGDYYGDAYSHVAGMVGGTLTSPAGVATVEGGFVAER